MIRILMIVQTAISLGTGEQVFLTGNLDELGAWRPDGVPMTRVGENRWEVALRLPKGAAAEFKVTRGTWDSEAVDADGRVPENHVLEPGEDATVEVLVEAWKDRPDAARKRQIVGDYEVLPQFHSKYLEHDRDVIVWLPPGYENHPTRRYPVLYMHDGRQVFDPTTSTWGKSWQVDELAQEMILSGELEPFIVVAMDCSDARAAEYAPGAKGDDYLRFILTEMKPLVDERWRTDPERSAVAGASMGGLISFYAAWKHPEVFEGAACLSSAFIRHFGGPMFRMVEAAQGELPETRLFLSCGGAPGLEAELLEGTLKMADLLKQTGFPESAMSVRVESHAEHNEEAWARMTPHWLRFLYGRSQTAPGNPGE